MFLAAVAICYTIGSQLCTIINSQDINDCYINCKVSIEHRARVESSLCSQSSSKVPKFN